MAYEKANYILLVLLKNIIIGQHLSLLLFISVGLPMLSEVILISK